MTYLIPIYLVGREVLDSRPAAGLATVFVAGTPAIYHYHFEGTGIVRAWAFLFALTGLYAGFRMFKSGDRRWRIASSVLFALTILSHPVYAVFYASSYVLLWVGHNRTRQGFADASVVAIGGILLTAPWWSYILAIHGPDVFLGAGSTHGGLFDWLNNWKIVSARLSLPTLSSVQYLEHGIWYGALTGSILALARRRYSLPAWFFGLTFIIGRPRFTLVPAALLTASVLVLLAERVAIITEYISIKQLVALGVCVSVLFAASASIGFISTKYEGHMTKADADAAQWIQSNTSPDTTFVVAGNMRMVESFGYVTQRTNLAVHYGLEWAGTETYYRQAGAVYWLTDCRTANCIRNITQNYGYSPDYIYTVNPELASNMHANSRYQRVYRRNGVKIFRVRPGSA